MKTGSSNKVRTAYIPGMYASYYSVQNILPSCVLSQKIKVKIYVTVIFFAPDNGKTEGRV